MNATEPPWSDDSTSLRAVRERLRAFAAERAWEPFHRPKDLAMCVSVEAGELLERWLWKKDDEPADPERVAEEMADVLISLLNLANRLDLDLLAATEQKIEGNARRYPVEKARGTAAKYDELG